MSITDDIKRKIAGHYGKRLFYLASSMPGEPNIRTVIASEEVSNCVEPPWPDNWEGQRHTEFRAVLDAFTRGDRFTVSEEPFDKNPDTELARVDPVEDEIWAIRCIQPNARIRCFGAFGGKDLFIALTWEYREYLEWDEEISRCKSKWDKLFRPLNRFQGDSIDDYLSNAQPI